MVGRSLSHDVVINVKQGLLAGVLGLHGVVACGDRGDDGSDSGAEGTGEGSDATDDEDGSGTESGGADTGAETGADTGTDTGSGTDTGTDEPQACPSPLPDTWIFCEDFESLGAPADVFFEYNDGQGAFVLVDDQGASGNRSMRVTYEEGTVDGGWVSVAFGRNPVIYGGRPHYRMDEDFDEIYWRLRLRMEPGWPDVGPAKVTRATAFAKDNWGQAMIAHLWSAGDDVTLLGDPASCVTGATVDCNQYNDFDALQWLGQMNGTTPLFSEALSGAWHCIEGHVTLNNPGQLDGVFEFWIDDNLENSRPDLDWRGNWTEYGINLVSFENYWNGGAPQSLQRWIDDIAIATVPIGCE